MAKSKSRKKAGSGRRTKTNPMKPVLAFVMILVLIGAAFYLGTKYDSLKKETSQQPEPSGAPKTPQTESPSPAKDNPVTTQAPTPPAQPENVTVTLYFPSSDGSSVVPEQRQVQVPKGQSLEAAIFGELQKGPTNNDMGPIIPEGTKLLSVTTQNGLCTLNLSAEFVDNNPGGSAFEGLLIYSVVNSLTELDQIKKVQFLIDGKKREVYSHMAFNEPFERNESFIRTGGTETTEGKLRQLGENALKALRDRDMERLSPMVHPDKKLRFSPYTFVDLNQALAFSAGELKTLMSSDKVYTWGLYDGSGEPIKLTFREYMDTFVYDRDFLNAEEVGFNRIIGKGNTINNIFSVYPDAVMLEYYFSGFDPRYEGLDWECLRLIFEQKDGTWYLVAVVHDQWTI